MKMFATSLTGKVQDIHGQIIINNNGLIETVVLGQVIPAGAKLQFNDNATLTLITDSNQRILLGGENQQILSETTTSSINNDIANVPVLISSSDDLIGQKKIIVPCSPIHNGGFEFVTLQRHGDELLATTDYSTAGQPQSILESDELFNNPIRHEGIIAKVDNYTVAEDNKIVLHLLDNDTSISGDPLSIDSINGTPLTGGDQTIIVDHGHISIATDGTITFIPKSNFNGDVNVDYTVTDGTSIQGSRASIVVTPVNDAATIVGENKVLTETNAPLTTGGTLTADDIDNTNNRFDPQTDVKTDHGTFTIDADGKWTFTTNSALNELNIGQSITDHFPVTSIDGTEHVVTVTIKGSEDTAVINGQADASVTEDSNVITESEHHWLKVDGTLSITDLDVPGTTFNHTVSASDAAWGTLAIDDKGHWTYQVNNEAKDVQGLTVYDPKDPHSYHVEHFTVTTGDGAKETITITIKGSEDTAVINGQADASVTEDSNVITESEHHWLKVDGTLSITDLDVPGTTFNHTVSASDTAWGTLAIDDKGHWTYQVNNEAKDVQGLTVYDPKDPHSYHVEHFTVTTGDGAKETITITIKGSEDTAVINGQADASVTEDSNVITESEHHWLKVDGTLSITDLDVPGTTFNHTVSASDAAWGTLAIDDKGHWTYQVNNEAKDVQGLTVYDPKDPHSYHVEHFTVTTGDGAKETITITIKGSEDTAVINGQADASVTEDNNVITESEHHWLKVDGTLSITDLDVPGTTFNHTVSASDAAWGTLAIDDKGHWTYQVNNEAKDVQGLTVYDPKDPHSYHVEHFTVTTGDGAKETITITIKGSEDTAVINGQADASVTEDSNVITESEHHWLKVDGTLSITDLDVPGTTFNHTVSASDAAWGTLAIDDKGHWTYQVNNEAKDVQGLTVYDPKDPHSYHVEHFTVTTGDGAKETITITIKGSEDTAVINGQADASVTEDSNVITESEHHWLKVDGTLSITDLDVPGTTFNHTVSASDAAWGTLAIDDKGHWTYQVNNEAKDVQGLTVYDPKDPHSYHVEHFTVTTGDGAKETITITIKGSEDTAVINGQADASVTEDSNVITESEHHWLKVDGTLSITDLDVPGTTFNHTVSASDAAWGTLAIDDKGHWTYQVNNEAKDVQGLTVYDPKDPHSYHVEHFTVTTGDGAKETITITIKGSEDTAVINGQADASVTEDSNVITESEHHWLKVDGTLSITDLDVPGTTFNHTVSASDAAWGTLAIDDKGHWTYQVNNEAKDVQGLTVYDPKDPHSYHVEHFTVTTGDGAKETITITIKGSEDTAVINGQADASVTEDSNVITESEHHWLKVDGTLSITDLDVPGTTFNHTVSASDAAWGTLAIDDKGHWTYQVNNEAKDVQGLTVYDPKDPHSYHVEHFTVTTGDGAKETITITIKGSEDTAVINGQADASVTEDSNVITESEHHWLKVDGTLSITDLDVPGTTFNHTVSASDAAWGTLAIDDKGHWTYQVNNEAKDVQGLTVYDPKDPHSYHVEHFTVTTGDGAKETITITIKGSEDTAVINGQADASVTEDSNVITESEHHWLKVDGTLSITDLDVPGTTFNHTVSASDAAWGTLAIDDKGHWTYQVNNEAKDVQGLTVYDPKDPHSYHVEHFTVTTGDGAKETITITIKGSEDTAVINGQADASVTEDSNVITESEHHWLKVDGTLSITDLDVPGTTFNHTVSASDAAWGTLAIDDKGHWTYQVNNEAKDVQGLTVYDPKDPHSYHVEHFTVTTGDGAKETITITIKGSEDTAVINGQADASVTEDSNVITESEHHWLKVDGTLSITDLDVPGTTFNHTVSASDAAWGTLAIDDKGHWTYQVNNEAKDVQGLTVYDPKDPHSYHVEHFTVTTGDGAKETITITIKGTNDAPIIKYPDMNGTWISADYTEGSGGQSLTSKISLSDIDSEKLSMAQITITPQVGENSYDPLHDSFVLPLDIQSKYELISSNYIDESKQEVGVWILKTKDNSYVSVQDFENVLRHLEYKNTADHMVGINQSKSIGIDVFDDHYAVSNRLSINVKMHEVNDIPVIHLHNNGSINISEEGLANGNPDNTGDIDTTNKTVAEGSFKVTDVDSTDVSVRLEGPDGITSDGKLVHFKWNEESQELNGFIDNSDHKVIIITLSHDHAGDYSYNVKLMAPIDHSINNVEDIQEIKIAVITNDGEQQNAESQQIITVNVEDDSPIIESSHQDVFNVVADTNIPNIISSDYFSLVSNHADTAELQPKDSHDKDGHFTVTAKAFENNHNANLIDGLIDSSYDGIGVANNIDPNDVKSTYQPNGSYSKYDYDNFPLNNEVEYRHIKDNEGNPIDSASEKIIITLDDNYVAYGLHIDFSQMFGGEKEVGAVDYYRNGKYLDTQSFSSDEASGDFAQDFNYHQGGFDRIVIRATDNGGKYSDNSDFSIKGIQFTGNSEYDFAKGYVSGDINIKYGADGSHHIGNSALSDGLAAKFDFKNVKTITGENIVISHDENSNTYYGVEQDEPSHHLFKFELTQSTGKWEFYQYSQINVLDNQGIKVNFTATDNDGDQAHQTIIIKPTDVSAHEVYTMSLHSVENEHSLLNLDLHSESISLHHQDGEKELTHFDVNKGHLDLSDLLHNATENTIDHYLTIHQSGNDTVLSVNVDAKNDVEQNIVLDNTKLDDVKANLGVITNNLLHFDGDKLILEHHSEHANSVYEPMVLPHQLIDEHNN